MSVDREYGVRINISANTAPAAEAEKSLEKLSNTTEEGGKAAERSEISHREFEHILHQIGHESGPAAGAALSGLAAAATGGVMIAVMALRELYEAVEQGFEAAKKFNDTLNEAPDLSGLAKDIGDVKKGMDDNATSVDKFFANLRDKASGENGFKQIADEQIAHLQRVAEAEKKLAEEEATRDKARLELLKSTHQITDEQYKAGTAAVDSLQQKRNANTAANVGDQTVAQLHQAMVNTVARETAAERDLTASKGDPNADQRIKTLQGLLAATMKKLDDVQKSQLDIGPKGWFDQLFDIGGVTGARWNETAPHYEERQMQESTAEIIRLHGQEASYVKQIGAQKGNLPNDEKIKSLEESITQLKADQKAIQEQLDKRADEEQVNKDQGAAGSVQKFLEAQHHLGTHQGTKDDEATIGAMNQLLEVTRTSDTRMHALLLRLIDHHGNLTQALDGFDQRIDGFQRRIEGIGK